MAAVDPAADPPSRTPKDHTSESTVRTVSPQAIADLYIMLPREMKAQVLLTLGARLTAEEAYHIVAGLSSKEWDRYCKQFQRQMAVDMMPRLLADAVEGAKTYPDASLLDLAKIVRDKHINYSENVHERAREAAKRERDPDRRFVERDDEIIKLRLGGMSYGKILNWVKKKYSTMQNGKPLSLSCVKSVCLRARNEGRLPRS